MNSLSFLQGIFSTQGSNLGLPHCGQILYQLSHKGSPSILEADLPNPGIKPESPALQVDSLPRSYYPVEVRRLLRISDIKEKMRPNVLCLGAQLCLTLCNPMDCIVHGILQARILEWVAFPFSRGSSQPRDQTQVSHIAGGFFTR